MANPNVKILRKLHFNNFIVGLRGIVRQAVSYTFNKLTRDASRFRKKKTVDDEQKEKNLRRADKYIEELKFINSLHPDDIARFAVLCIKSYQEVGYNPNSSIEERALTRLSEHKCIQPAVKKFKVEYPNWASEVPDIIKSLGVSYRKKRLRNLASKGKLEPVMEKERKMFKLLHEVAGLELDPKLLKSKTGVIKLNKKKKIETEGKKPVIRDHKEVTSKNEEDSDSEIEQQPSVEAMENETENMELEDSSDNADESEDIDNEATDSEGEEAEEYNFETSDEKNKVEKIELAEQKIIESEEGQENVPVINSPASTIMIANNKCNLKEIIKSELSHSKLVNKELENNQVSKNMKLKMLQSLERKYIENVKESASTTARNNKGSPLEVIDSIFTQFDESRLVKNKKYKLNKSKRNSIEKKPIIKSVVKGTCAVKQIDLKNDTDLFKKPTDMTKYVKGDESSSSDDENSSNSRRSPNFKGYKSPLFLGRNFNYDDSNNEELDGSKNKLKNYEKVAAVSQKQYNDGLTRYERRRQKFGPVGRFPRERTFCNRGKRSGENWVLDSLDYKRQKVVAGPNAERNYSSNSTFSNQNRGFCSGSNNLPLGNRKPAASKNKPSQERLLHPSWVAKKKETEQSSALDAFQGKRITFDD